MMRDELGCRVGDKFAATVRSLERRGADHTVESPERVSYRGEAFGREADIVLDFAGGRLAHVSISLDEGADFAAYRELTAMFTAVHGRPERADVREVWRADGVALSLSAEESPRRASCVEFESSPRERRRIRFPFRRSDVL